MDRWYNKEDSWAVIIGLGVVVLLIGAYLSGSIDLFKMLMVKFATWQGTDIMSAFRENNASLSHIFCLYSFFALVFGFAAKLIGLYRKDFFLGFMCIYFSSIVINIIAANKFMKDMQLEAAFVALVVGLLWGNLVKLPKWLHAALKTEFYVKTGIVLMGATLPLTVIFTAGPIAILQAMIVAVTTFFAIYLAATKIFKLDPRFGATLGAGGSICGVSAAIAIGSSCRAKQEHVSVSIALVIVWAVVMIFALPFAARLLELTPGVAGAWIGTSEFADAAGFAAAASIGEEAAIRAFTLMKVVGRDIFVGVWALLAAFMSVTYWDKDSSDVKEKVGLGEIWHRFPKFVLGFAVASVVVSMVVVYLQGNMGIGTFNKDVIGVIKSLRGWAFTWTFLSIGLTTRFRELSAVGWKPLLAFTVGVLINVPLGYVLSSIVFVDFWNAL